MNIRVLLIFASLLAALLAHGYLTLHYYPLHFGFGEGMSLCNLSALLDCNAVSASRFSSWLGIPLAVWGLAANGVLLFMVLVGYLGFATNPRQVLRYAFWLSGVVLSASLVMAFISLTQLQTYCLFCILAYVSSIVVFLGLKAEVDKPLSMVTPDLLGLLTTNRSNLLTFVSIPLVAFFVHKYMVRSYDLEKVVPQIDNLIAEWQSRKAYTFDTPPSLVKGAPKEAAKMVIVEFADFRCGHCKMAAPSVAAFLKNHPEVRLEFYNFPLDRECNKNIARGDGLACRVAQAIECLAAQGKGWELHDAVFAAQETLHGLRSLTALDNWLSNLVTQLGGDWSQSLTCINDPQTFASIQAQAEEGAKARIEGTPTFFVNGRLLERGQKIPVLEAALKKISL